MNHAPKEISESEWNAWLIEAERRLREVYKLSPERLIAEHRREREITRGYHGREILELLQNAADAARKSGVSGKLRIVITPHGLVMGNTGRAFDFGGVQSLQTANLSPKRQREAVVIGDKGLGFRSILNWTHSPLISSGELRLAFLSGYAENVVSDLTRESKEVASRVCAEREIAGDLIVPRLAFPQWIPDWQSHAWPEDQGLQSIASVCSALRGEGFDTVVGMPFSNPQAHLEAVQQANELKQEFLLLVDSVAQLEVQIEGWENKVWSCERSEGGCILREGSRAVGSWSVFRFDGEVPRELLDHGEHYKNRFQLTIAIPNEGQVGGGCLFSYFPTEVQIPLPLLAHATVELDETRKHVNDTRANRHILKVMAERIAELAEQQVDRHWADAWAGCRLVTPAGAWGAELEKFGIPAALRESARNKRLIPVLGGGHLSARLAKSAPGDAAKWWPARLFPGLADFRGKDHRKLAAHLGVEPLSTEYVVQRLLLAGDLTVHERAHAIAGLLQTPIPPTGHNLAALLCDETETPMPAGASAILQSSGGLPLLPSWATIRFLHPELRRQLGELLESKESRELQQKLRPFGVVEYSLSALIRPVMTEGNRQVRDRPQNESLIREEALRFLWQVHRAVGSTTPFPTDATVKLKNQEGTWTEPKELYLGEGYGQEGNITQDLYAGWAKRKLIANAEQLGLNIPSAITEIASFLVWLGVARWPREIGTELPGQDYLDAVKASLSYPVQFEDCRFGSLDELLGVQFCGAKTLDGLMEILRQATTEVVLAWLVCDPRSSAWFRPSHDHGTLRICPSYKQYYRRYTGALPSYIHWQIATFPWLLSNDGTKKPPRGCLIGDRQLDVLFPGPNPPNPVLLERYGISSRLNEAFQLAGVMPGLAQLGRDELYRLLLEVPKLSPDGKAGRALCRWFVSNEASVFASPGPYQERFFSQGKVWGTRQGESGYFPLSELRHIDQEGFPMALTAKLPIADLPKRIGAQKVKDILGIKPLDRSEIRQELVSHRVSSELDNRAAWFDAAKPFIKRLRQTQSKQSQIVGWFDRLKLYVCDELRVQMQYEEVSYDHMAEEGESFVFFDHLYVRGDLEDSLDLLADAVGAAVASIFGMAEGDAFSKILRCAPSNRAKLLKRMCGDQFHEEIETASVKPNPVYAGPIEAPAPPQQNQSPCNPEEPQAGEQAKLESGASYRKEKTPGVISIPHKPLSSVAQRKIVVRGVQPSLGRRSGSETIVDGERCERMAAAFEEQDNPSRYTLGVGHITGLDAPGFDLVSFASNEARELFQKPETRNWSTVLRFIEVKGRSSSTAKIELKGNELKAAREYGERYFLYRFYEAANGQFIVTILQNPMDAEEAKATIIEVDLDRAEETQRFEFVVESDVNDTKEGSRAVH